MLVAGKMAKQLGVEDAFRLVVNNGEGGGQTVFHLHLHLLAGRDMKEGELAQGLAR
jgi:histidine triad (HIT) family protein